MIVRQRRALIMGCALFVWWMAMMEVGFSEETTKNPTPPVSLSEVVLFGVRPICDLDPSLYPEDKRPCVASYLKAVPEASPLRKCPSPPAQDQALAARRKNLEEQMTVLLGESARWDAKRFAGAVPLCLEWEGMSEGPLDEAELARQWLDKYPETPLRPFLHLFMAHRFRAGFEASRREFGKGLPPILAGRYHKHLNEALKSSNHLIKCVAEDLDAQPYVYLPGSDRP